MGAVCEALASELNRTKKQVRIRRSEAVDPRAKLG